jgi:SAM-dependent methyltransferase
MTTDTTIDVEHFGKISVYHRTCPSCGRDNDDVAPSRYSHAPWSIKECDACGFVYIDSAPRYEVQVDTMAWERTTKVEEARRAEIRPISYKVSKFTRFRMHVLPKRTMLGFIETAVPGGGNVVDLGCGDGHAMAGFPAQFTPFGIEISAELARAADRFFRARGGAALNAPCVEGLRGFPKNFFVAASLRSYLEHEAEPLAVLYGLRDALKPEGLAVVKVPNYGAINRLVMGRRWCGFRYPDHLNYFTPKTLSAMADKAGFTTSFGPTGRLPTSDNMWAVLKKRG